MSTIDIQGSVVTIRTTFELVQADGTVRSDRPIRLLTHDFVRKAIRPLPDNEAFPAEFAAAITVIDDTWEVAQALDLRLSYDEWLVRAYIPELLVTNLHYGSPFTFTAIAILASRTVPHPLRTLATLFEVVYNQHPIRTAIRRQRDAEATIADTHAITADTENLRARIHLGELQTRFDELTARAAEQRFRLVEATFVDESSDEVVEFS